ncbi:hypothetical protein EMCRGX_G001590 [Ephydatia muelleri]
MRLELVFALLVIAVVSIGTSAEDSGSQHDVDDEWSVRDAFDDDGQSVLGDDGRSVRRSDREKDYRCKACYKCRLTSSFHSPHLITSVSPHPITPVSPHLITPVFHYVMYSWVSSSFKIL